MDQGKGYRRFADEYCVHSKLGLKAHSARVAVDKVQLKIYAFSVKGKIGPKGEEAGRRS